MINTIIRESHIQSRYGYFVIQLTWQKVKFHITFIHCIIDIYFVTLLQTMWKLWFLKVILFNSLKIGDKSGKLSTKSGKTEFSHGHYW